MTLLAQTIDLSATALAQTIDLSPAVLSATIDFDGFVYGNLSGQPMGMLLLLTYS